MPDGTLIYELGVIYFECCTRDKSKLKKMSQWWLVDVASVIHILKPPTVEKVSGKHFLYTFDLGECSDENKDT